MSPSDLAPDVRVRRAYDEPADSDGQRILVDRLWPRGISKERARLDHWARDVAPSTELRKWYGHDPDRFEEFAERYRRELTDADHAEALEDLRSRTRQGRVTLLTASRRDDISAATVLRELLLATDAQR